MMVTISKRNTKDLFRLGTISVIAGCALLASSANATTVIRSGAYGVEVNLSVLSVLKAQVGPLASTDGIAGTGYDTAGTLASLNQTLALGTLTGLKIGTGLITTGAESVFPLTPTGNADALVNGLNLSLTAARASSLGLTATTLTSHSEVEGVDAASATGTSKISGLKLTVLGIDLINLSASEFITAPANSNLLTLLGLNTISGLNIMVNEQVPLPGSNAKNAGITTNALHLIFSNFLLGTDRLYGDVIISSTRAYIDNANSATPEPATWIQMITGFGLIGVAARRRKKALA